MNIYNKQNVTVLLFFLCKLKQQILHDVLNSQLTSDCIDHARLIDSTCIQGA